MKHFTFTVSDYEHEGDLQYAERHLRNEIPEALNVKTWEEEDYEAMADYEEEYGECEEPICQGYISFDLPDELAYKADNFSV